MHRAAGNLRSVARWHAGSSLAVALACVSTLDCGGQSTESTDLLQPCEARACPTGMICSCGVCTLACGTDAPCSNEHPRAACVTPPSDCFSTERPIFQCDVVCNAGSDCDAVGADYRCVAGRCRPRQREDACALPKRAIAGFATENKLCDTSADCVAVETRCYDAETCANQIAVRRDYDADTLDSLLADLAACTTDCPVCASQTPGPTCVDGVCRW